VSAVRATVRLDRARIEGGLEAFVQWLRRTGYASQDQYDFWATDYGIWAKARFYRHGTLAAPLVAPLLALDWFWPGLRRRVAPPRRFAIGDAHYLMGFAARYRTTGDQRALDAAIALAATLLESSVPGFAGPCWGYPFDWQTRRGLVPRGTPLITTTPYVFDAFLELYELTGVARYREVAVSIAGFAAIDIRDLAVGNGFAATYTPFDASAVINASAYRAACLARAAALTGDDRYRQLARGNAQFVVEQQRADGAWPYSAHDLRDGFIDHIHTCFVLKGLYRTSLALGDGALLRAVERGYEFYRRHLFHRDGRPRPFAETAKPQIVWLELYDYAEALNLALLLRAALPTEPTADELAGRLLDELQMRDGAFVTRVLRGGLRNRVPYHRWAQAQAFCALSRYAEALTIETPRR